MNTHLQLRDMVADEIRRMIAEGQLRGGEWIRQEPLAKQLGTSFTPVREALKQLEAEGLIEHVPYRGVRVVEFAIEDLLDIYTMRGVLEGLAAATAAVLITSEQLVELRQLHERMCQLHGLSTLSEVRQLNQRFHLGIAEASQRKYLIRTLRAIWTWFPNMLWSQYLPQQSDPPDREREDNAEHAAILVALEAHNPEGAENALRHHINRSRQTLVDYLAVRDRG